MAFFPELWGSKTLEQMKNEPKKRLVSTITDYTNLTIGKKAKGYNGPKIGYVEAKDMPYTDFTDPTKTNINFSFDQQKGVGQILNDVDEAQTNLSLLNIYTTNAKDGLLDSYDGFIVSTLISGVSTSNALKLKNASNVLAKDDILAIRKKLNVAKAPLKGRTLLVNADHESDLYAIPDFVSRDKIKDSVAMQEGVIGRILGFDVILYSDMPLVNADGRLTGTTDKRVVVGYQSLSMGFGRQKEFGSKVEPKAGLPGDYLNIYSVFGGTMQEVNYAITVRDN